MSVFTCDNFRGHYPVGVAAVIVASSEIVARQMLLDHLASIGLPQDAEAEARITIKPLPAAPGVTIISDGNY